MIRYSHISTLFFVVLLLASFPAPAATNCDLCHGLGTREVNGVHRYGVGNCSMCHVMHNSQDGDYVDPMSQAAMNGSSRRPPPATSA